MRIRCPTGTTISVQLAQFGRNSRLPPQCFPSSHTDLLNGPDPASNNVTCIMPTAIQVFHMEPYTVCVYVSGGMYVCTHPSILTWTASSDNSFFFLLI